MLFAMFIVAVIFVLIGAELTLVPDVRNIISILLLISLFLLTILRIIERRSYEFRKKCKDIGILIKVNQITSDIVIGINMYALVALEIGQIIMYYVGLGNIMIV